MENQNEHLTLAADKFEKKVQDRITTKKIERHDAIKKRQEHEALVMLNHMRERRMHAEVGVNNLKARK